MTKFVFYINDWMGKTVLFFRGFFLMQLASPPLLKLKWWNLSVSTVPIMALWRHLLRVKKRRGTCRDKTVSGGHDEKWADDRFFLSFFSHTVYFSHTFSGFHFFSSRDYRSFE